MADRNQAAHDVADHVVQEGVGLELEAPVGAAAADGDALHGLDRAERLAGGGAEAGEVVLAEQTGCGVLHGGLVQRAEYPADAVGFQAGAHR